MAIKNIVNILSRKAKKMAAKSEVKDQNPEDFYNQNLNDIHGKKIDLKNFKSRAILIVNTASKCGFTPQIRELQKLQDTYKEKLVVIGMPCNDFGKQEPGNGLEICDFMKENYNATYLLSEKVSANPNTGHPLIKYICENAPISGPIQWNFEKFIVNTEGFIIDRFTPDEKPMSKKIRSAVETAIN